MGVFHNLNENEMIKESLRLKFAFFYGFIHAFFGLPVIITRLPQNDEPFHREFIKGFLSK